MMVLTGATDQLNAIAAAAGRADAAARAFVAAGSEMIRAEAMRNAPVRTGTLRRSINVDGPSGGAGHYLAHTGPTVVYGRRIELGFTGADSLGRHYNQAPRPYLAPGVVSAVPQITSAFESMVATILRG